MVRRVIVVVVGRLANVALLAKEFAEHTECVIPCETVFTLVTDSFEHCLLAGSTEIVRLNFGRLTGAADPAALGSTAVMVDLVVAR